MLRSKLAPQMAAVLVVALSLISAAQAQAKKRVAVLDFDYATVRSDVAAFFGTQTDVGKGVADLLVTKLVQNGTYSVIERKQIDKVLAEQNFGASGRVDDATAAKIGRILGVDVLILGSIHTFGRDDSSRRASGGGVSVPVPGFGGVKLGRKKDKAVVGINFRMVSTDTAEILAAGDARGESKREGALISGAGGIGGVYGAGGADMSSSNFAETVIGEAVYDVVNKITLQVESKAANLPARAAMKVDGMVAEVVGSTVVLNVGTKAGVKVGDKLSVRRVTREVKDPATGQVIRVLTEKVGEVVITEADEISAVGNYSGSAPAKIKDKVTSEQ
jgi:curli biogenesis system outer membrane secretion channel CsgG